MPKRQPSFSRGPARRVAGGGVLSGRRSQLSGFLITIALAGIGLSMSLAEMRRAGHRPLLLGAPLWAPVALSSLGLQALTGTL